MLRSIVIAVTSLALVACRHGSVVTAADLPDAAPPPPAAAMSRFSAPLAYDFTPVLAVVERSVPSTFGSLDSVRTVDNDQRRHYAFTAERAPFTAFADGGLLHLRTTLAYRARGFYKPIVGPTLSAGCGGPGEDRPRIAIQLGTPLSLTGDWHLASHVVLESIAPVSTSARDRCDVTILHHDVTSRVVEAARAGITAHLADIDRKIAGVDLGDRVHGWWGALSRPIRLSDGVWLELDPQSLAIGPVTGSGHMLDVPVTLQARPRIVTSASEPPIETPVLPPLGRDSAARRFHILIDGVIDYAAASAAIDSAFAGKTITERGRTVAIATASVAPLARGRLAIAASFTGDARGTLRLIGTPVYDSVRHEVAVPDLDFDLVSDDRLVSMYSWLQSDAMRTAFRSRAHLPVALALDRGRTMLLSGLNRTIGNTLTLRARVDSVGVRGLYVTRAGIVVRAEASGHASAAVGHGAQ